MTEKLNAYSEVWRKAAMSSPLAEQGHFYVSLWEEEEGLAVKAYFVPSGQPGEPQVIGAWPLIPREEEDEPEFVMVVQEAAEQTIEAIQRQFDENRLSFGIPE